MSWLELVLFADAPFEIIDGDRGKNYPKQNEFRDSGYCLFLSATNVTKTGFDFSSCQFIDEKRDAALNKGRLQREDIVMTTRGTIGNTAYYNAAVPFDHLRINSGMVILRCDRSRLLPAFLYQFVRSPSFFSQVNGLRSGVAQPQLPIRDMRQIKLPLPPMHLQRRIAGILSAYDDLIENSQRRIKVLEAMARNVYREWFVHFRFPGHECHPRVASPLGDIPQTWEVKSIREIAGLISRGPSLTYVEVGGIPVVNQRCIRNHEIEMQAVQYAAPLADRNSHLYLRPHDTLINSMGVGTLGRVSRNLTVDEKTIIHNCVTVVRAKANEPTSALLFYRLSDSQEHFERLGVGATGQTSLRLETIEEVQAAFPPTSLLSKFEDVVLPMWGAVGTLKRQIQNLRRTRDLLLPRLLSGQINVEAEGA